MHQSDNLQKARRATALWVVWFAALLHVLQVVQVQINLQYESTAIALLQAEAEKLVWCWQVDGKPIMQTAPWYLLQADACTKQLQ